MPTDHDEKRIFGPRAVEYSAAITLGPIRPLRFRTTASSLFATQDLSFVPGVQWLGYFPRRPKRTRRATNSRIRSQALAALDRYQASVDTGLLRVLGRIAPAQFEGLLSMTRRSATRGCDIVTMTGGFHQETKGWRAISARR